jgi:Arc/MetJ-type ribon-helix-helix transcriptional regulator
MPRTEIELTEEESQRLDEVAASKGQSVAEVVHESVREYLGKVSPEIDRALAKQRALAAVGKFRSSVNDLGTNHDRYLEEDFAD